MPWDAVLPLLLLLCLAATAPGRYFAETFQTTVPPLVRFLADKKFFLGDEPVTHAL